MSLGRGSSHAALSGGGVAELLVPLKKPLLR